MRGNHGSGARGRARASSLAAAMLGIALGCASAETMWHKPNPADGELERVRAQCEAEASRRASENTPKRVEARDRKVYYTECMNASGWYAVPKDDDG